MVVGLLEKHPYEVFVGLNYDNEGEIIIPKRITMGKIIKDFVPGALYRVLTTL